jgi:hypothetical protein
MAMNLEQSLLEKTRQLPVDKQLELLDFAEFLAQKSVRERPLKSIKGLCADLKVDITEEDIKEARQEMWGNFPREDLL